MHRPRQHLNIPTEIVRTVVAIAETGSLSKAGERLGLSQPAISSQVKRLQSLVGGALFVRTANGTTTTELGKVAVQQARRILEANDQLLRLGGNHEGPQPLRLGMSTMLAEEFLKLHPADVLADVLVHADMSPIVIRGLIDGYIDIAFVYSNPSLENEDEVTIAAEADERSVWVRSRDFVLRPGAPIPILAWPGDDWMIRTLTKHNISYKIVFRSPNHQLRLEAARAGYGLTACPERMIPSSLISAKDYYLPELPVQKRLLCVRPGLEGSRATAMVQRLSSLFFSGAKPMRQASNM
ncbi:LysR family transcriptional regulator [Bradyrhizobium sp. UFLA03-84]|uniref:LysR family transcriptional regulator n=1 Tax=Bradyrhizobium sp. UFLA03-84 TaxID=418599 RepID=UPI001FD9FCBD|nr:LysR family transcriptional regulator [Bradyrhizobium sp. UFLA03-84]